MSKCPLFYAQNVLYLMCENVLLLMSKCPLFYAQNVLYLVCENVLFLMSRCPLFYAQKDRKSTRLNSSHQIISYAVFCLKKNHDQDVQRHADGAEQLSAHHPHQAAPSWSPTGRPGGAYLALSVR